MITSTRHNLAVAAYEHAFLSGDPLDVLRAVAPAISAPTMTTAEVVAEVVGATSRQRAALAAGVGASTIDRWLRGAAVPDAEDLAALRALALRRARDLIGAAVSEPTPRVLRPHVPPL